MSWRPADGGVCVTRRGHPKGSPVIRHPSPEGVTYPRFERTGGQPLVGVLVAARVWHGSWDPGSSAVDLDFNWMANGASFESLRMVA